MADTTTATLRVTFGQSLGRGDNFLSAEIDSREDGPNEGQSSFAPGDTVWFLVYKGDAVTLTGADASAGSATLQEEIEVTLTDDVVFDGGGSASLTKPAQAITNVTWLGRNLGDITLLADRQTVKATASGVGIARVTYQARATAGKLTSPESLAGETGFPIAVVISGAVAS
jgi:hypothetical protein